MGIFVLMMLCVLGGFIFFASGYTYAMIKYEKELDLRIELEKIGLGGTMEVFALSKLLDNIYASRKIK